MGHINIKKDAKPDNEHIGYMVGVEYLYHLGASIAGGKVYPNIKSLYKEWTYMNESSYPQDGIVKVRIEFIEHVSAEKCWDAKECEEK